VSQMYEKHIFKNEFCKRICQTAFFVISALALKRLCANRAFFKKKREVLRCGFWKHPLDTCETTSETNSGAEDKCPGLLLHVRSIDLKLSQQPRNPKIRHIVGVPVVGGPRDPRYSYLVRAWACKE